MLHYKYVLYLILSECVIVYCKNHTTYTFNPRISHVRFLSIPKNAMFLGNSHQNSLKTLNRNRFKDHLGNKAPEDEDKDYNDSDDYKKSERNDSKSVDLDDTPVDFKEDDNDNVQQQSSQRNEDMDSNGQENNKNEFIDGPPDSNDDQKDNNLANQNYDQVHITNQNHYNEDYSENKDNPKQDEEDNKQIVNDIAKEEQMKDMHNDAGQMMNTAKEAKEKAEELLNQYKEGSYNSETNKHSLPKDEAGNIIITNTTTTPTPKHEEEKVDPLKSIRDATLSLFERAKHKNLPVSEPGDLSTPEQIYTALNTLEYIIDGYRYTKIDINENRSKDEENNSSESDDNPFIGKEESSMESSNNDNLNSNSGDEDEETLMNPDRFLQVKKHRDQDDDEFDDEGDEEEPEDEDEDDEKGNDFHQEEEENENDEGEDEDSQNKSNTKKEKTLSPHEAMEDLRGVLNKLTSILEQVVFENTGVKGVIMRESVKVE